MGYNFQVHAEKTFVYRTDDRGGSDPLVINPSVIPDAFSISSTASKNKPSPIHWVYANPFMSSSADLKLGVNLIPEIDVSLVNFVILTFGVRPNFVLVFFFLVMRYEPSHYICG